MIEEVRDHLPSAELLAAYRSADHYLGDRATQSELEQLRRCSRIVIDSAEHLQNVQDELIGGSLEEEKFYFEARLIRRALEQGEWPHDGGSKKHLESRTRDYTTSSQVVTAIHQETLDEKNEFAANRSKSDDPP